MRCNGDSSFSSFPLWRSSDGGLDIFTPFIPQQKKENKLPYGTYKTKYLELQRHVILKKNPKIFFPSFEVLYSLITFYIRKAGRIRGRYFWSLNLVGGEDLIIKTTRSIILFFDDEYANTLSQGRLNFLDLGTLIQLLYFPNNFSPELNTPSFYMIMLDF